MNPQPPQKQRFIDFLQARGLVDEKGAQQLHSLTYQKQESAAAIASRTGMVAEQALTDALAAYTGWHLSGLRSFQRSSKTYQKPLSTYALKQAGLSPKESLHGHQKKISTAVHVTCLAEAPKSSFKANQVN